MPQSAAVDRSMTVNDIIARFPATVAVFNQYGVDACCGGAATIDDAAARDGADAERMIAALQQLIEAQPA